MNNKYFSDRQEKMIAEYLGWHQVIGSGARPFTPGDVGSYAWLGECKTHDTEKSNISFLKSHWVKICEEAYSKHRRPILFKDNGTQRAENTWVMVTLNTFMPTTVNAISGLKNTSRKGLSFTFDLADAKHLYQANYIEGKFNVFKLVWNNQELAVMPLTVFKDFIDNEF